jgi:hypothetical protein
MHYFERETIMSLANALDLSPNEITVLEHVRTYEYDEGEMLPYFIEIRVVDDGVIVKKNRILSFPLYETEQEQLFSTTDSAIGIFHQWINEMSHGKK